MKKNSSEVGTGLAHFLSDLLWFRPRHLAWVFLLLFARSLSEGATFLLLIPLLGLIGVVPAEDGSGRLPELLRDLYGVAGVQLTLVNLLAFFLLLIVLRAWLSSASAIATARFQADYVDFVRRRLYESLSRASWLHLAATSQAHDTHALTMQAESLESGAQYALTVAAASLTIMIGVAVAVGVSPALTLAVVGSSLALGVALLGFQQRAYKRGAAAMRAMQQLYNVLVARMGGLKLAKAFAIERQLERDFAASSRAYRQAVVAARENSARAVFVQEVAAASILVALVYASVRTYKISSLELIMLIAIFSRLLPLAMGAQAALRALVGTLPEFAAVRAGEMRARAAAEPLPVAFHPVPLRDGIELRQVSFRYPGAEAGWTLRDVSLLIPAGKSIGIVGLSGAGKSTLADVIAGLLPPTQGALLIDGNVIDDTIRPHWRAGVTYVPQDAPLFHDTLRANLLIGARNATDADVWSCLELVRAAELVRSMPAGLDTLAGDRGVRLSGGERQRLRLASALLRNPKLLILDEATNALNPADEVEIVSSLRRFLDQSTIVTIAHRISSVGWTDLIIVVDMGRVADVGPPGRILHEQPSLWKVCGS